MRPDWLMEIKWSDLAHRKSECWQAIKEFVSGKRTVTGGVFTTKTISGQRKISGKRFDVLPCAVYCYTVGYNTVRFNRMNQPMAGAPKVEAA